MKCPVSARGKVRERKERGLTSPTPLAIVPNGFVNVTPEVIYGGIEKYCDFAFVHEAWKRPFFPSNEVCFHPASRQLICLIRIFE